MEEKIQPNAELSVEPSKKQLSRLETKAIKELFKDFFIDKPENESAKEDIFKSIKEDLPSVTDVTLKRLYREAEHEYYQSLSRIPAEALVNKINETSNKLITRVLNESQKDIVDQAKVVNDFNKTLAAVNRLTDVAPKININFHQELPSNYLLDTAIEMPTEIKDEVNEKS